MRILIVGAGSTGGYFGSRLAQAGRDVTFLVREKRAEQLRKTGLQVKSPHGDFSITPKLVTADALKQHFDIILVTVKAFALDAALKDVAPAVGPETIIIPVLNGMKQVDAITERFGAKALVGGVCKVATYLDGEGRIVQMNNMHYLSYGEMDGTATDRVRRLHETMQGAGFDAHLSADIQQEMWEKWLLLVCVGSVTCLSRGNVGQVLAAPGGNEFALQIFNEAVAAISAVGRKPSDAAAAQVKSMLTQSSPLTSSMYRDLIQGFPIEAEQIVGDLLARAKKANVATPMIAAAYVNLSVYQAALAT